MQTGIRVRRFTTGVCEVRKVAMWICDVRFDTPEAEDNFAIALAGEIFGGVKRFSQRYSKTTL